jgi:Protein of unknown function (DUF669)
LSSVPWGQLKKAAEDATKPVPDGWYDLVVTKATVVTASTGSPMIKVVLNIETGPHADRPQFDQFVLSEDNALAMAIWFRQFAAFGLPADAYFAVRNPSLAQVAEDLLGRHVRAKIGTRRWQGVDRNDIQEYQSPMTGPDPLPIGNVMTSTAVPSRVPPPGGGGLATPSGTPNVPTPSGAPPLPI